VERVQRPADPFDVQAFRAKVTAAVGVLLLVLAVPAAHGGGGARTTATTTLAPGLTHEVWELPGSSAAVHVARRAAGSPVRLQLVHAVGGLETTTSMCRRTPGCQVAVNGDFFTPDGAPVGAVVVDSRMLRSPRADHEQLSLEPLRATSQGFGPGGWTGVVQHPEGGEPLLLDGVNVPLAPGQLVLYTTQHGGPTPACTCREVRLAVGAVPVATLGRPAPVTVTGEGAGGSPLPVGTAVLAAEGAAAAALAGLIDAAGRLVITVSVAAPTVHNLGAHPVVLRGGQTQPYDEADPMLAGAHPRTVVAWDAAGTVWLIAADGRRRGGHGMTAREVLALVRRLGGTDAAMLDGGGSTTFVARGRVANTPSEGRERPVANAVLLIWQPPAAAAPEVPVAAEEATAPAPVELPAPPAPAPAPAAPAPVAAAPAPVAAAPAPPVQALAPASAAAVSLPGPPASAAAGARRRAPLPERPVPVAQVRARPPVPPGRGAPLLAGLLLAATLGAWLRVVGGWPHPRAEDSYGK
jgi:hypothetical protein